MSLPARNSIAVIGAGPIGLEAASAALDRGFDVHLFERGQVGTHVSAWGHVNLFTPWRMNLGPSSRARLERGGWTAPDAEACPTGAEFVERYLEPLAASPELAPRVHAGAQVVHLSRRGALKADSVGKEERRAHPFRLLVRDPSGRESLLHTFHLIDASGVYGQPNWAGDGGIPAKGELYLAPQMSYHLDDVRGLRRTRYAGRRTLVLGSGASAATAVSELAALAAEVPGTSVVWVTRRPATAVYAPIANDPLTVRVALYQRALELIAGADPAVMHIGGSVIDNFEFNSATHRYRVALTIGSETRIEEVDHVLVLAGFGPDNSLYRELQVHECYASRAPMKLAAALRGADAGDCLDTPSFGADTLSNPEPDFYILGNKSYGRGSHFLLETGYQQVTDVMDAMMRETERVLAQ